MIMHIILTRLQQLLTVQNIFHTTEHGAYSSLIPIQEQKHFSVILPKALSAADIVVLADIYAARETDNLGISSADLQKAIGELGKECYYFHSFEEIEKFLLKNCINGDLLITMGAGDVYKVGEALVINNF